MSRPLLAFALLSLPVLAQAGQLTLSPAPVTVDNGEHSVEIVVTYRPGEDIEFFNASLVIDLDRLGWAEVRLIPSTSPDYYTGCRIHQGAVRVWAGYDVFTDGPTLPPSAPIPLCRLRVRPHAHTPSAYYRIDTVGAREETWYGLYDVPANRMRVFVP